MSLLDARAELDGRLFYPGDDVYEKACRIFNSMVRRHPVAVVQCGTPADVIAGLRHARERDLEVSVRAGGHNVVGHALCDGVVLDISGMDRVVVDPVARTARVQGGATWAQVDAATGPLGLATPGGRMSTTGVGGLTLGGGQGWLSQPYGLACDNIIAAEVVTVDGRIVHASDDENPDLFWALRGGGGNFGVVTEFTFRLHMIPTPIIGGILLFPVQRLREILRSWRAVSIAAPDELATGFVVMTAPPEPFVPEYVRGQTVVSIVAAWFGAAEDANVALAPLRALGPALDLVSPLPYEGLQKMLDSGSPTGLRSYWTAEYIREMSDEFLDAFAEATERGAPAPLSTAVIFAMGNGTNRVPIDATAFGERDARWMVHPLALWADPADDEVNRAWARSIWQAVTPFGTGAGYLNAVSDDGRDRVRAAHGPNYGRLVEIKRQWDPENVFRHTQNIPPD